MCVHTVLFTIAMSWQTLSAFKLFMEQPQTEREREKEQQEAEQDARALARAGAEGKSFIQCQMASESGECVTGVGTALGSGGKGR